MQIWNNSFNLEASAGMAVHVRALGSGGSRSGFRKLSDGSILLRPQNLGDNIAVGDVLSAVDLGCLRRRRNSSRGSGGGGLRGGRGRSSRAALLALLLEDVAGKRRGLVGRLVTSLVGQAGRRAGVLTVLEGDLDVTGEDVGRPLDVVTEEELRDGLLSLDLARRGFTLADNVEQGAVLNATRGVGAGLNSLLQEVPVPAHPEVTVEAEA